MRQPANMLMFVTPIFYTHVLSIGTMNAPNITAFFIRLPIAMSFLCHGLVRLPKLEVFAEGMVEQFANTLLPDPFVRVFAYLLVFAELITGIWLLSGKWFGQALITGLATMAALIFGSGLIENWGAVSVQLVHSIYLAGLLLVLQRER